MRGERFCPLSEVVEFLRELPGDQRVRTILIHSEDVTIVVDGSGNARVVRKDQEGARWFLVELPTRH